MDLGVYPLSLIQYFSDGEWSVESHAGIVLQASIYILQSLINEKGQQAQVMSSLMSDTDGDFNIYGTKARIQIKGPIYRPTEYLIRHYKEYSELSEPTTLTISL